jgi:hypothetical protein
MDKKKKPKTSAQVQYSVAGAQKQGFFWLPFESLAYQRHHIKLDHAKLPVANPCDSTSYPRLSPL